MCGITGGYTTNILDMLDKLQHRGFNEAGIRTLDRHIIAPRVKDLPDIQDFGIGHVRYRTNDQSPSQPYHYRGTYLAFNGEVFNGDTVKLSETLHSGGEISGAYSFVWMFGDAIFVGRDPNGFHPLFMGYTIYGIVAASETVADPSLYWIEVPPGYIVDLRTGDMHQFAHPNPTPCCFEDVYFSHVSNRGTWNRRQQLGGMIDLDAEVDVIVPVPESAIAAAEALSQKTGIPCVNAIVRNRYTERTFIAQQGEDDKYTLIPEALWDKRILLVDDSIVRGITMKTLVPRLKRYAKEVHIRVTFPPIKYACQYGIRIEGPGCHWIPGADSLKFLDEKYFTGCKACVTGVYPNKCQSHKLPSLMELV